MNTPQKICTQCGLSQPIEQFDNEPKSSDGKTWYCKTCIRAYNASRIEKPKLVPEAKVCNKCQLVKPIDEFGSDKYTKDGHATRCKACKQGESLTYQSENREKTRAATARWHAENAEKEIAWRRAHKDERSEQRRARYAANPHKENAQTSAYYFAKKDELRPKRRAWDQAHPGFAQEKNKRRRAQVAGSEVNDLTHAQWLEVQEAQDHRCYYCGKRCKGRLTQDHLTPLSKGGAHTLHNVIGACMSCNSRKGPRKILKPVQPLLLTISPSYKSKKKGAYPCPNRFFT